jgi:transposase
MGVFKRQDNLDQGYLLPPSLKDWLPADHLAWFITETVDELDLDRFLEKYRACGKGEQAYPPRTMLRILLYAYATGVFSSRRIAAKLETDVAFRVLGAGLFPDFRTICAFRTRHRDDFAKVFVQVVQIAREAGLAKFGTLAVDGTKIKANASKHRAMSYDRMKSEEKRLRRQIQKIIAATKRQDALEDQEFGPDFRGDELPAELADRQKRRQAILAAKKRLERRKAQEAREEDERKAQQAEEEGRDPPKDRPELRKHPKGKPKPKDQENFTDPDSRIMLDGSGAFQQCYNAQIAVDDEAQIIVASLIANTATDVGQLIPVLDRVEETIGVRPRRVLADAGYRSERNFTKLREREIDGYVALGRENKTAKSTDLLETTAMKRKLGTQRGRATYKKRKHVVESPFGWIKAAQGFRQFLLRGIDKVSAEWDLICTATNLKRMASRIEWA